MRIPMKTLALLLCVLWMGMGGRAWGATTNYGYTATGIYLSGYWTQPGILSGSQRLNGAGANSQIDVVLTGTDATIRVFAGSGNAFEVSVDGGVYVQVAIAGGNQNVWYAYPLFSSLSDTAHTVSVKFLAGGTYFDRDNLFQVTGASPATSAPAGYDTQRVLTDATLSAYISPEGYSSVLTNNSYPLVDKWQYQDATIRFRASCTSIKIWSLHQNVRFRVAMDGVMLPGSILDANDNLYGWTTLASGLPTGVHTYQIITYTFSTLFAYALMLPGDTGLVTSSALPVHRVVAFYGDSITAGQNNGTGDTSTGWVWLASLAANLAPVNRGVNGATVVGASGSAGEFRVTDITTLSPAPAVCVILYGTNDRVVLTSQATFGASYLAMLNKLTAGLPSCKFICLGILPVGGTEIPYNNTIASVVAGMNNPNVVFKDTATWINPATDLVDSVHPNTAGDAKVAVKVAQLFPTPYRRPGSLRAGSRPNN